MVILAIMFSALPMRCIFIIRKSNLINFEARAYFSKMTNWQNEKQNFLSMGIQDKRKLYAKDKFYTIKDVPTWKEHVQINANKLPEAIPLLVTDKINPELNNILADKISIFSGDITTLEIDVIVNAANKALRGGGGVDGAIHLAAGQSLLQRECQTLNGCPEGEAKLTGGYRLPAKYIIHTVGPRGEKPGLLQSCYRNSIELMLSHKFRTVAFPCISTGIYGYPLKPAAHVAVMEVRRQLEKNYDKIDRVIFCLFGEPDEQIYQGILQTYFPLT